MSGLEGLLAGRVLVKRYRVGEVIGRGGFAAVYRAEDLNLGRAVAVKVITLGASDESVREQLRARFQREARSAASLPQHPNVVTVHDFGTDPELGLDFLVMELLRGTDLATHLAAQGPPSLQDGLRIVRDTAEGLAVGHRAGLVHRDVKPGNIFLAENHEGDPVRICVVDFGIAQAPADQGLTLTGGSAPLSPAYASPEQLRGDRDLTPASDVFSLGVVAYQVLTGERPFASERRGDAGDGDELVPVRERNPRVAPALDEVILRALDPRPEGRYADAGAFAAALDRAPAGEADDRTEIISVAAAAAPVAAPLPSSSEDRTLIHSAPAGPPIDAPTSPQTSPAAAPAASPARRAARRRGMLPLVLTLLLLAGGGFAAFWMLGREGSNDAGPRAAGDSAGGGASAAPVGTPLPGSVVDSTPAAGPGSESAVPSAAATEGSTAGGSGGVAQPPSGASSAPQPVREPGYPPARPAPRPVAEPTPVPQPQPQPRPLPEPQPQPAPEPLPQPRPPIGIPVPPAPQDTIYLPPPQMEGWMGGSGFKPARTP